MYKVAQENGNRSKSHIDQSKISQPQINQSQRVISTDSDSSKNRNSSSSSDEKVPAKTNHAERFKSPVMQDAMKIPFQAPKLNQGGNTDPQALLLDYIKLVQQNTQLGRLQNFNEVFAMQQKLVNEAQKKNLPTTSATSLQNNNATNINYFNSLNKTPSTLNSVIANLSPTMKNVTGKLSPGTNNVTTSLSPGSYGASYMTQQDWTFEEQFKQLYDIDKDPGRKIFLDDLFKFMQEKGKAVSRIPIMAKQVLDLYRLYNLVVEKGGLVEVINRKLWREITKGLNLPNSITSAAFTLRTQYMKYLYEYECKKRNLSSQSELDAAIEGNKREGRKPNFMWMNQYSNGYSNSRPTMVPYPPQNNLANSARFLLNDPYRQQMMLHKPALPFSFNRQDVYPQRSASVRDYNLQNFNKQEQKNGEKRKVEEIFGETSKTEMSSPKRPCLEDSIAKCLSEGMKTENKKTTSAEDKSEKVNEPKSNGKEIACLEINIPNGTAQQKLASNENDDKLANCDVGNLVTINLHMNGRIYEGTIRLKTKSKSENGTKVQKC